MRKILQSLRSILAFMSLGACASLIVAALAALDHVLNTPQPLKSILPGDARLYHWRYGHIFYKMLGDENAPPLVLLHTPALGASAYEMRKIIGALAQRYHVYALDLLGFGLSDHPRIEYSADIYISMCHDFLTEVVGQPATLLASGLSCNYAVIVAKRFPAACTRLVLISPSQLSGNKQEELAPKVWSKLLNMPAARFLLYSMLSSRPALLYTMHKQHSHLPDQLQASAVDYLYATTHQLNAEYAAMALLAGNLSVNALQDVDALHQPTLVIWGANALNNSSPIKKQQNMSTQTEIALIQDAGIYVHEEYPALVVANILEWSEEGKAAVTTTTTKAVGEAAVREVNAATGETLLAYCVKCKKKTPMRDAQEVVMKNGVPAAKGICSICGTGQYRIGRIEKENL